ncbi:uncharacterized protein LOC119082583 [Bradysia coprophila]|uniref:uncharacterized protein LOC119082583 n=1 Tax=Bradysia coprophila TaxID=38358 RepID=UPI00187DBEEF|nr:uncharacterized protein LOC119082583 [Bradysia coprophila]
MNAAAIIFIAFAVFPSNLAITADECIAKTKIEEDNLRTVLLFYKEAFVLNDITAVDRYISSDYIQHNPNVDDGQQPLKDLILSISGATEKQEPLDIRHTAVNKDMVWLHVKMTGDNNESWAVIDIFRVKDGKIVEHWDVIQEVPSLSKSKNLHPMF